MPISRRTEKFNRPCDQCRQRRSRCDRDLANGRCALCEEEDTKCTFIYGPTPRRSKTSGRLQEGWNEAPPTPCSSFTLPSQNRQSTVRTPSTSYGSLGPEHLHTEYISPFSYHEPSLLNPKSSGMHPPAKLECCLRRVDESTIFMTYPDGDSASEMQRIADLDRIEGTIRPLGPSLVKLYFNIVHPTFPILHKDDFLDKHARSHHEFPPSLLAGVYLIALDWQQFNKELAAVPRALDAAILEDLAMRAIENDMKRPTLSTLQAGLLLLQRVRRTNNTLLTQLVFLGQTLGIHVDCSDWFIPAWERGLRCRLAWALYMQDKWGALVHGRPSLISDRLAWDDENNSDWDVRPCTVEDFHEILIKAEDVPYGSVDAKAGRVSFIHAIELTRIFSQLQYAFCSVGATKKGGRLDKLGATGTMALAESFAQQLRQWYTNLPGCLKLDTTTHMRGLSANGALHLSHMAAELTLHRAVLRALRPETPPSLKSTIRTAARARLLSALKLVETLQPKHTQSFWGFAAPAQMAMIGSFAGLLWATSADCDEAIEYVHQIERLRWALQVRGSAVPFIREAIRMLDEETGDLEALKTATYQAFS